MLPIFLKNILLTDIGVFPVSPVQAQEYQTTLHFQDLCKITQKPNKIFWCSWSGQRSVFMQSRFSWENDWTVLHHMVEFHQWVHPTPRKKPGNMKKPAHVLIRAASIPTPPHDQQFGSWSRSWVKSLWNPGTHYCKLWPTLIWIIPPRVHDLNIVSFW